MSKFLDMSGLKRVLISLTAKYNAMVMDIRNALLESEQYTKDSAEYVKRSEEIVLRAEQSATIASESIQISNQAIETASESIQISNQAIETASEAETVSKTSVQYVENAIQEVQNASQSAQKAASEAENAKEYAEEANSRSIIAINAVAKLEGLNDATEAAQTLADTIVQIETNTFNIENIMSSVEYLTREQYKLLEENGQLREGVEYNIYK